MKIIITKAFALTALLLMSLSINAAVITINYEVYEANNDNYWGDGFFTGKDSNADNILTFDELISFFSNNRENVFIDLSNLSDIGDFDIINNLWLNNAISWDEFPNNAWFTADIDIGGEILIGSVNEEWAYVRTSVVSMVPAPPAVWLFISGLIFLIGVMRKRALRSAIISA